MIKTRDCHKFAVAALASVTLIVPAAGAAQSQPLGADAEEVARLLERLADPEQEGWQQIEEALRSEWSKSGSPAMDLLLERGRTALEEDDLEAAIDHLTALTDHAPDFAEAWNLRATAHFRAERFGLALEDIRRTLALNPSHFAALTGLAIILEQLGMKEEALEIARKVIVLNPHREDTQDAVERLERETQGKSI